MIASGPQQRVSGVQDIRGVDAGLALDRDFLTLDMRWTCLFDAYPYPHTIALFSWCRACARVLSNLPPTERFWACGR